MDSREELPLGFSPSLRIYKDGSFERPPESDIFVPPSIDPVTGVSSKDADILPQLSVSARLYLPKLTDASRKLPVLVYYHGGGFCVQTPFSPLYHRYLNSLVAEANVVAVSVHYRRAPEHRLPIAYDDAWASLQWTASHADGGQEVWLREHSDFDRVFVAGDSAGANIAHNIAMRAGREEVGNGVKLRGAFLIHPYFWSVEASERLGDAAGKAIMEGMWSLSCPSSTGLDDPQINPMADGESLKGLGCKRLLVCTAEKEYGRDSARLYYHAVASSGWEGESDAFETEDAEHLFHLYDPNCKKAAVMMKRLAGFLNT